MLTMRNIRNTLSREGVRTQMRLWGSAFVCLLLMTVLTGVVYPGVSTAIAQVAFPYQANGSVIEVDGKSYGSELLAQEFTGDTHMWGRIMMVNTATFHDAEGQPLLWAGPSNLSPASKEYEQLVAQRVAAIHEAHPEKGDTPIPSDLVTCSGSGLDPHISPAAAEYQVERLARTTGKSTEEIQNIIETCTDHAFLGVLGQDRVNVLRVNLMLDGILS